MFLLYMLDGGESEVTGSAADCAADLVYYAAEGERLVGLVKTRRLAAMQKQQRAIHLRRGYGGLKAGMKPPTGPRVGEASPDVRLIC
jgi:hypothetical protein